MWENILAHRLDLSLSLSASQKKRVYPLSLYIEGQEEFKERRRAKPKNQESESFLGAGLLPLDQAGIASSSSSSPCILTMSRFIFSQPVLISLLTTHKLTT